MTDLRQAAEMALDYIHGALISHDQAYGDHPAMKKERDEIAKDLEALRQALAELDTGIDRGAWSDVPDATKWVDELRGDDVEEPPNSTTDFLEAEPVAWGTQNADGQITDVITPEEHDRIEGAYTIPLYTAPPKEKNHGQ